MPALACQLIEPAGNVVRLGPEGASQLQRKATASVLYILSGGQTATIAANTPAIPWTASTGFGSAQNAPTAAATIDVTTYAGRWVTFLVAASGGTFAAGQMYVCQVTDWTAVAGPAGGRTVVPLDLWELHSWRYCGFEFTGDQALRQSGTYQFTTTDIPVNSDYSAVKTIAYGSVYGAGIVPDVVPGSQDKDWFATAAPTPGAETTHVDVQLTRYWRLKDRRQTDFATATVLSGNSVSGSPAGTATSVTYPTAYQSIPSLAYRVETVSAGIPTGIGAADYAVTLLSQSATGFTFILEFRPATYTGTTSDDATGITTTTANGGTGATGAPTPNASSNNATETTGMTGAPIATSSSGTAATSNNGAGSNHSHTENTAASYTQNATTSTNTNTHSHSGPAHTHNNGDHTHNLNNHYHDLANHTHTGPSHNHTATVTDPQHHHSLTLVQPAVGSNQTRAIVWVAIGPLTAPAATVKASWMAAG